MPPKRVKSDGLESNDLSNLIGGAAREHGDGESEMAADIANTRPVRKAPSMARKAILAREKALIDKFAVVQDHLQNHLDKDSGVVVDAFFHAKEKNAPVC
jgi:hypothetical protein